MEKPVHDKLKVVRERAASQGFMRLVGAKILELEPGICTLEVTKRPELLQNWGMFHGGVTAFLIDNATTMAASTMMLEGQAALTAEYKLNLIAPAAGENLVCRASVIKPGRMLSVVRADVFSLIDGREKQTATALATIAAVSSAGMKPVDAREN